MINDVRAVGERCDRIDDRREDVVGDVDQLGRGPRLPAGLGDDDRDLLAFREHFPDTPLLGAWSRWHWNHPGPLLFWIAAPLYHLIGNVGVLLTCTLLAAASSAGVVLVALRRGGHTLGALSALLVVVLTGAFGLGTLADPWNPFVALIPFLLFLFLFRYVLFPQQLILLLVVAFLLYHRHQRLKQVRTHQYHEYCLFPQQLILLLLVDFLLLLVAFVFVSTLKHELIKI